MSMEISDAPLLVAVLATAAVGVASGAAGALSTSQLSVIPARKALRKQVEMNAFARASERICAAKEALLPFLSSTGGDLEKAFSKALVAHTSAYNAGLLSRDVNMGDFEDTDITIVINKIPTLVSQVRLLHGPARNASLRSLLGVLESAELWMAEAQRRSSAIYPIHEDDGSEKAKVHFSRTVLYMGGAMFINAISSFFNLDSVGYTDIAILMAGILLFSPVFIMMGCIAPYREGAYRFSTRRFAVWCFCISFAVSLFSVLGQQSAHF